MTTGRWKGGSRALMDYVRREAAGRCHWCGRMTERIPRGFTGPLKPEHGTFDHVIPLSRGGPDRIDNIVLACNACNLERSKRVKPKSGSAGPITEAQLVDLMNDAR